MSPKRRTVTQPAIPSTVTLSTVRKVCDFSPARPGLDTLYSPCLVPDPAGDYLYTLGGHIDSPQRAEFGLADPRRFADEVFVSRRLADGTFSAPKVCISKRNFPWMTDGKDYDAEAFLRANPEAAIGCCGGASVVRIGDLFYALVPATVSDPNITTGDNHGGADTVYGSRSVPWAHFALFWFVSADGENWTIVNMHRDSANVALQYAALYADPATNGGIDKPHEFVGLPACSLLGPVAGDADAFRYRALISYTGTAGQKNGLVRCRTLSDFDRMRNFAVWDAGVWGDATDGMLPPWFTTDHDAGQIHPLLPNQIAITTHFPGWRYVCATPAASQRADGSWRLADHVELSLSNDLVSWPVTVQVRIDAPGLGDDAVEGTFLNPIYCEDGNGWWLMFGAYPGVGGYVGASIWEARA